MCRRGLAVLVLSWLAGSASEAAERWQPVGPDGGTVVALAADADPRTVYAAVAQGGVYRSDDGGRTWVYAAGGLPPLGIRCLAADPATPGTLYLGSAFRGIWKTTDGGRRWRATAVPLLADVRTLAIDPRPPHRLVAGFRTAALGRLLMTSDDGGHQWTLRDLGQLLSQGAVVATEEGAIYFGGNSGIARSLDGGVTWEKILDRYDVRALAVSGGIVYAATATGFLRGVNRGASWRALGRGLPTADLAAIALDPSRPIVLYAAGAGGGVFRSADGGLTWSSTPAARAVPPPRALLVPDRASGLVLAAPAEEGVWRSDEAGASWSPSSRGLRARPVSAVVADPRPGILYAGVPGQGLMRSADDGVSWRPLGASLHLNLPLAIDPQAPAVVYALATGAALGAGGGAHQRLLYRSQDGGRHWALIDPRHGASQAFVLDPARPGTISTADETALYRSADRGASWTRHPFDCLSPRALALSPGGPAGELYVAGFSRCAGTEVEEGGIERSTDGGATFENLHQGLPTSRDAHAVAVDPRAPEILLSQVSGQPQPPTSPFEINFYRSADHGASWSRVGTLERLPSLVQGFAFPRATPESTWMATDGQGLLFSADAGATWSQADPAPPSFRIFGLALTGGPEETLFAATSGGLFRRVNE